MDKNKILRFRGDFAKAVAGLEKEYGIKIRLGNITYTNIEFHGKLTCSEINPDGKIKVDTSAFEYEKNLIGLNGNIGDKFFVQGHTFMIDHIDLKKRSYPVIATRIPDGRSFKFRTEVVNDYLKR